MKCTVIRVNPASFDTAVEKVRSLLALPGEKEITLSFASGNYFVKEPVCFTEGDAPAHLRLIAGGRQKTVFSSLAKETILFVFQHFRRSILFHFLKIAKFAT